jgi:hypothetical protein
MHFLQNSVLSEDIYTLFDSNVRSVLWGLGSIMKLVTSWGRNSADTFRTIPGI